MMGCSIQKEVASKKQTTEKEPPNPTYIEDFHKAVRYKMQGRLDESRDLFKKCLTIKENEASLYFALGEIDYEQKNYNEAETNFLKAKELNPKNRWYLHKLAVTNFEQQNYAKSAEYFEKLVKIESRNSDWQFQLAECYIRGEEIEKAITCYDNIEEVMGVFPGLSIQKYQLYLSIKENDKAVNELNEAINVFPNDTDLTNAFIDYYYTTNQIDLALDMLKGKIQQDPKDGQANLAIAEIYLRKGNKKEAFKSLNLAFNDIELDVETKIQAIFTIKERYASEKNVISELVTVLISLHADNAAANSIHADMHLENGNMLKALNSYQKASQLDPSKFAVWNQIVLIEYQEELYDELYNDTKKSIELFPTSAMMYLMNGIGANKTEKFEEAIESLTIGQEYVLDQKDLSFEFDLQMGIAYFGVKDFGLGNEFFKKALEKNDQSNIPLYEYAKAQIKSKQLSSSTQSLIDKILEKSPNNLNYNLLNARYNLMLGKSEKARDILVELKQKMDIEGSGNYFDLLGDILFDLKEVDGAIKNWKLAKENGCSNSVLEKKIIERSWYDGTF